MKVRVTKKVRDWAAGESTTLVELSDEAVSKFADTMADIVAERLRGLGHTPVTVCVELDIAATVLVATSAATGDAKEGKP